MRRAALLLSIAGLVATFPALVETYREGPLPAMTGGFGEKTCRTCHFDNPLNAKGGALRVDGVPATFMAGQRYTLTVTVRRPDIRRAGFEMTARFASGSHKGEQAGEFRVEEGRTQIVFAPSHTVQYIQHNKPGSQAIAPGEGRWTVSWIAPAESAPIIFHVAGNAANDDNSPLGDFIYLTTLASRPTR